MAGRGLRTGNEQTPDDARRARDETLVRVCDLADVRAARVSSPTTTAR